MRLLLQAVSTDDRPVETRPGLRGQPLVRVQAAGLAAWATSFAELDPCFGRTDLLEHHHIISRLHAQLEACLPARFPTWYADVEALRAELGHRQTQLRAGLDAVRGHCELAITVLWTAPAEAVTPSEATTPGTRYLRARQQAVAGADRRRARARELADEIERLAGADLVAVRRQVCPSPAVAVSAALLAPRARASELIARLPRTRAGVRILVNGPWPAYTFAGTGGREV